jgi:Bacterial extracellular solute-binding protein
VNAQRTGRPGKSRPNRRRRVRKILVTLLAAAVAVTVLVGLGAHAVMTRDYCNQHPVVARIAVSGDVAPVVERAGEYYNRQHRMVSGHCVRVAVQATAPSTVTAGISRQAGRTPDAWVPDSNLWIDIARGTPAGAKLVRTTPVSVARSPLVIVMPRRAAARMPAYGSSVSWRFLMPESLGGPSAALGLHAQFPNPTRNGAGLAILVGLRKMFGYGRPGRTAVAEFVFNLQVVPPSAGGALPSLASLARPLPGEKSATPVTVTTEQAAIAFDQAHPRKPLALRYPEEGTFELTYPYAVTSSDPERTVIARQFGAVLQSSYVSAYAQYAGFRSAGGALGSWPASFGLTTAEPKLRPLPGPALAARALGAWQKLNLGVRLLTLIDVSSVMATPVAPGGPTLEQVFAKAASIGLGRLPDSTQLGLWEFASKMQGTAPYKQVVTVGPLPGTFGLVSRRQRIERLNHAANPIPGRAADLYGTILAAYQSMVANYQPQYSNTMIVMTAGVDNAPGDISASHLVRELKSLYSRQQNIEILAIQLGRLGNFSALRQVAEATNGKAYDITDPTDINSVFFQTMGRRICQPHCPPGPSATRPSH